MLHETLKKEITPSSAHGTARQHQPSRLWKRRSTRSAALKMKTGYGTPLEVDDRENQTGTKPPDAAVRAKHGGNHDRYGSSVETRLRGLIGATKSAVWRSASYIASLINWSPSVQVRQPPPSIRKASAEGRPNHKAPAPCALNAGGVGYQAQPAPAHLVQKMKQAFNLTTPWIIFGPDVSKMIRSSNPPSAIRKARGGPERQYAGLLPCSRARTSGGRPDREWNRRIRALALAGTLRATGATLIRGWYRTPTLISGGVSSRSRHISGGLCSRIDRGCSDHKQYLRCKRGNIMACTE